MEVWAYEACNMGSSCQGEAADQFLNLVLDSGINFIDTSPDYESVKNVLAGYRIPT